MTVHSCDYNVMIIADALFQKLISYHKKQKNRQLCVLEAADDFQFWKFHMFPYSMTVY